VSELCERDRKKKMGRKDKKIARGVLEREEERETERQRHMDRNGGRAHESTRTTTLEGPVEGAQATRDRDKGAQKTSLDTHVGAWCWCFGLWTAQVSLHEQRDMPDLNNIN
jgi:hypothetical protein